MENEIITVDTDVPAIADTTLIQIAEQAEKRVAAMQKIKMVALRMTNARDWVDQSGNPYLQVSGSEKVARLFGISWRIGEPVLEHEEGGHYTYTYKGQFSLAGATIEAIGTRSSKDGFFKKYEWENGAKTELPASAIDKGDVKKAAFTNLLGNGITRLLGLRNLSYADLEEFAGIRKDMIGKVEYKTKGKQQDKTIASEGAQSVSFCPTDVRQSSGTNKKTGKKWTKFAIKNGDVAFNTFSESFATIGKEAKETGRKVKITFAAGEYGNDVEAIVFDDDGPEPGSEG